MINGCKIPEGKLINYCSQMECFKEWLHEPDVWAAFMSKIKNDEMQRIISQVDNGMVGIGSGGVYRLNYNFIAQVCHL